MKLKTSQKLLAEQAREISAQCLASQSDRIDQYVQWRNYLYAGARDASKPAILNKVGSHIDRLASFLFAPAEVRFLVEFGLTAEPQWQRREQLISRLLTDEYAAGNCDLQFSTANFWGLVYGSCFIKQLWSPDNGLQPHVVTPNQLGVWREDINGLDRQEAITNVTYISRHDLWRRLHNHPNRETILSRVSQFSMARTTDDIDNIVHQVIIGGITPVQPGQNSGKGTVDVFAYAPTPQLSTEVARDLVRFMEVWVKDDDTGDYTTLQYAEPDLLLEPVDQKRNIFLKEEQPFLQVMANDQQGYFWGRSEIADLSMLQDVLAKRLDDIAHIWDLRAHPPYGVTGTAALSDELRLAFRTPDGLITAENPNAKFENLAPELPQDAFTQVDSVIRYFDDTAGFAPVLMGQGEPGVRTGVQAQSLNRSASARMRDRALVIERQAAAHGELCLQLLADKNPTIYGDLSDKVKEQQGFTLAQMPEDRKVTVDSHSSSPAFTEDHRALAFALQKAGAITPRGLLMLTNPPQLDMLLQELGDKEKKEQELIKAHPELLEKMVGGRGRRR